MTVSRVVEELARSDGSVAWSVLIASAGLAVLGFLPRHVAEQLASDRQVVIAGTLMPAGQAAELDGGYRVSGRWAFASGIRHAKWLYAASIVMDGDAPRRMTPSKKARPVCGRSNTRVSETSNWRKARS